MRDYTFAAMKCGLERGADRALLQVLGGYSDRETGFARVSIEALAFETGLDPKSVRRAIARLSGEAHDHLIAIASQPKGGPGASWTLRAHWERLSAVADAVRRARRVLWAGVLVEVREAGLSAKPATFDTCQAVISTCKRALVAGGFSGQASELLACEKALNASRTGWPNSANLACGQGLLNLDTETLNLDFSSPNLDISSHPPTPPYKDTYPQGLPSSAQTPDPQADPSPGGPPTLHALAALATERAQDRKLLAEMLIGCQLARLDNALVLRAASQTQHDDLMAKFGVGLFNAAYGAGFGALTLTVREVAS